jgi:hypothetical protein
MSHIEILLPFGVPPAELAKDLLRDLKLPALSMLLGRGTVSTGALPVEDDQSNEPERAVAHETWLAERFGMGDGLRAGGSPPVAPALMRAMGLTPEPGHWFIVQPVHFHIARDHLVLTDPRRLALSEAESRALHDAALPSFEEAGLRLLYGRADTWFVKADRHADLLTASPDATCGRNIDIWMPKGESARAWRKLQNIVQMDWHASPVNEARAATMAEPVNSVWLWGGAPASILGAPAAAEDTTAMFGFRDWFAAFATRAGSARPEAVARNVIEASEPNRLLLLDALISPALAGDWAEWLAQLQTLEAQWFAPLLAALRDGKVDAVSLIMTHGTQVRQWQTSRNSLRKFWRQPTLAGLLP